MAELTKVCKICLKSIYCTIPTTKSCSKCYQSYHYQCVQLIDKQSTFLCTTCQKNPVTHEIMLKTNTDKVIPNQTYALATKDLSEYEEKQTLHNYETKIIEYFSDEYFETSQLETLSFGNSSENTFIALAINIRSIANINNFSRLEALLASLNFKPDLISLTETWIKLIHSGPYKNLDGYNFISNFRQNWREELLFI